MRIVLDTNILVRAFAHSEGPANGLLKLLVSRHQTIVLSNDILQETARVLRYPRLMGMHGQDEEAIYNFILFLREVSIFISLDSLDSIPIRDQNDQSVMRTAINGDADVLCTLDRDFYSPPAADYLSSLGIEVLTDTQLLGRLKAGTMLDR